MYVLSIKSDFFFSNLVKNDCIFLSFRCLSNDFDTVPDELHVF